MLCWFRLLISLLVVSGLCACSSTSLFRPYPSQIQPALAQLDQGQPVSPDTLTRDGTNRTLHWLEAARVAQIQGDRATSLTYFGKALDAIAEQDREALIALSDAGELGSAMLLNDNALSYQVSFYERAMAHAFQALNYLYLNDLEGAGVEARRANLVDIALTQAYESSLASAQAESPSDNPQSNTRDVLDARLHAMNERAAQIKSVYTSAYAYFISGLVYELRGEINAAHIDYKKALELNRDNPVLIASALATATRLGFQDERALLLERAAQIGVPLAYPSQADNSEIIVLYEQDWNVTKHEESFAFAAGDNLVSLAVPVYLDFIDPSTLLLTSATRDGQTYWVTDFQALAAKTLQDQLTVTLTRQIARAAAKRAVQEQAEKHAGTAGLLAAFMYTLLSESADLRSWLSLPAYSHIARLPMPAGDHTLSLRDTRSGLYAELNLTLKAQGKTLIQVINTGTRLHIHPIQLP